MTLQEKIQKKAEGYGKLAPAFLEGAKFALENRYINYQEQKPPFGVEVIAYHHKWVDEDFNPNGTRIGFYQMRDLYLHFGGIIKIVMKQSASHIARVIKISIEVILIILSLNFGFQYPSLLNRQKNRR